MAIRKGSWRPDEALIARLLVTLAKPYPGPLLEPEPQLLAAAGDDREALFMHLMYLQGLRFVELNLVELFRSTGEEDVLSPARLSWAPGPRLTKKGLAAHLGAQPTVW